jgi:hypothetical protein
VNRGPYRLGKNTFVVAGALVIRVGTIAGPNLVSKQDLMPMVATWNSYTESKIQGHLSNQFCFSINVVVTIIE